MRGSFELMVVIVLSLFGCGNLAPAEEPQSVRVLPNGDEIRCYGSHCERIPAAKAVLAKVVEAVPTPADIRTKPTESISVASPPQPVRSVLVNLVQATRNTVQSVRYGQPMRRLLFRR